MYKKNITPITNPDEIRKILLLDKTRQHGWVTASDSRSPDKPSTESLVLHCSKCNFDTSGVHTESSMDKRRCPACASLLMYCPACKHTVSATEKFNVLSCDRCEADFVDSGTIEYLISRDQSSREIVLSGIRATGELHIGNYFGAVRQFVEYEQGENLCMYFIADWHTLTTSKDPRAVSINTLSIAMDYLAVGLNPERSVLYAQSSVPEIAELALCLSMIQSKNRLEDLATVKDLVRSGESMSMGHLSYPVLMAADILGPKATLVPVGSDQIPNVELARDLAEKFNKQFGQTFVVPRVGLRTVKVPGLKGEKMGKSEGQSSIVLSDSLAVISDKYRRLGITDPKRVTSGAPGSPDNCVSVYPVYKILHGDDTSILGAVEKGCKDGSRSCVECKTELARHINNVIAPFREKRAELSRKQDFVKEVLHYGGMKARELIRPTLEEVREKLGIISV